MKENVRGIVVRRVYANARQFFMKNQLELALRSAWEEISQNTIEKLINELYKQDGGPVD